MSDTGDSRHDTRQRVLESAVEAFAAEGFRDATVHEICEGAEANIAAVNYYFGSKENLYVEAWRKAFHDSVEAHPPDGGVPPDAPPGERLRGRIRALIRRAADERASDFAIVHKELANPTGLLEEVMRECLEPLHEQILALVRELLGPGVGEQQGRFCLVSIFSQCHGPIIRRRLQGDRLHGGGPGPLKPGETDAYADHVVAFTLAGIRAVRRRAAHGRPAGHKGRAK